MHEKENKPHHKDFPGWNTHKQHLDKTAPLATFNEREIWWCSIGVNVGHETDGKNRLYNRPVLVVKKFNAHIFWGVAMSKQVKDDPHYFPIEFKGSNVCVMLSHLRLYDSKRLHSKAIGRLPHQQFEAVKTALKNLL